MFSKGENMMKHFYFLTTLNTMKKLIVLCAMIVALGFVATGCGDSAKKPAAPASPATTTPSDADEKGDSHEGHDHP
jgi:hypothetical protein